MNRSLSTFIDLCRVAAAGVVVFGHLDALGFVPVDLHGRPHHLMQADLAAYPPMHDPEHGLVTLAKAA